MSVVVTVTLKSIESEIQDFQFQKQQKINELEMIIPLRPHQTRTLDGDYSNILVFDQMNLERLKHRVSEIQEERQQVKRDHKQLRKKHLDLIVNRKEKQDKARSLSLT